MGIRPSVLGQVAGIRNVYVSKLPIYITEFLYISRQDHIDILLYILIQIILVARDLKKMETKYSFKKELNSHLPELRL
jgi:hypothetical protein